MFHSFWEFVEGRFRYAVSRRVFLSFDPLRARIHRDRTVEDCCPLVVSLCQIWPPQELERLIDGKIKMRREGLQRGTFDGSWGLGPATFSDYTSHSSGWSWGWGLVCPVSSRDAKLKICEFCFVCHWPWTALGSVLVFLVRSPPRLIIPMPEIASHLESASLTQDGADYYDFGTYGALSLVQKQMLHISAVVWWWMGRRGLTWMGLPLLAYHSCPQFNESRRPELQNPA